MSLAGDSVDAAQISSWSFGGQLVSLLPLGPGRREFVD
jgi:hypothetical protein